MENTKSKINNWRDIEVKEEFFFCKLIPKTVKLKLKSNLNKNKYDNT